MKDSAMKNLYKTVLLIALLMAWIVPSGMAQDEDLQALLDEVSEPDGPAFGIWISTPDETYSAVTGYANLEAGTPAQATDAFRIGSITKTFTATLILMLQEEGVLSVDDPISEWLPQDMVANIANGEALTIRHLLTMRSGIPDYLDTDSFLDAIDADPDYPWTAAETLPFIYGEPAQFAPGEFFEYSNTNYNLLELIINAATDMTLANAMQDYIFDTVGMENSFVEDPTNLGAGIIQGYEQDDNGEWENITLINDGVGMGDGGIVSTAPDLTLFIRALVDGELLEDETLALMQTGEAEPDDPDAIYGMGINIINSEQGLVIGHEGSTAGFIAALFYYADYDAVVVAFTNDFNSELVDLDLLNEAIALIDE